ncbi:hypothetical protein C0Q70_04687 [Pomacea canaliculata]|uniref:Uncharacterized protein n=1 Tax=Pomacea canaliculata TaxID=400727 RepID=A0A2T7PJ26_POMCA|nr:hypothetical protein C0Q70_04687 [Pomacea canaliculata]
MCLADDVTVKTLRNLVVDNRSKRTCHGFPCMYSHLAEYAARRASMQTFLNMIRECANNPHCSPGEMNAPPQHHPDSPTPPRHHPDTTPTKHVQDKGREVLEMAWMGAISRGGRGRKEEKREIVLVSLGKRCGQVGVGWR